MNRRQWIQAMAVLMLGATPTHAGQLRNTALKRAARTVQNAFKPFYKIGGVLGFIVYEGASNDDADAGFAIHDALAQMGKVNDDAFNALHPRRLTEAQFFGDWYDPSNSNLIWNGNVTTSDGRHLTRPTFKDLAGVKVASAGAGVPDIGQGGQFAYAFANPPYGLTGRRDHIQDVFNKVRQTLLPPGHACIITDWASPDLDQVSAYFAQGKEWWGIFLFTIRDTTTGRLTVILGSTTD